MPRPSGDKELLRGQIFPDTEMGRLCRATDWSRTPLGAVESWSVMLRGAVAMVLRQGMPQCLCWGPELAQVYNDAFRVIMGEKHPGGLGRPVLEVWAESAGTVGHLMERVVGGETVYFEDLAVPVRRGGILDDAFFTFSYSPVLDDSGAIGGLLINCSETTAAVLGRRAQEERDRLTAELRVEKARLEATFEQSPSFFAILRGPENVFEAVNHAYSQIIGLGREVLGKPLFEAIPETRGQGFDGYLAQVRETGEPMVFRALPVRLERTPGVFQDCFIDITYLPLTESDGTHTAVIAHGTDVTEEVMARQRAEQLLARSEAAREEVAAANEQLQESATELEVQTEELQAIAAQLEERTEEAETARAAIGNIVESVTDGFVAFDQALRYTYVNARAAEMWARKPGELIGKTPMEVWPESQQSSLIPALQRVLATRKPEVQEGFAASLDMVIELRVYPAPDGGIVAFFADLTERRRAEESARFLANASGVLAASGDYQTTLTNLANLAVPLLRDWCAIDTLADPNSTAWPPKVERVAAVHQDPEKLIVARNLTTKFPQDWSRETGNAGVIRARQPMFIREVTDDMVRAGARNEEHYALLHLLDIRSIIIVPLISRERVLGTMTLVMAESGRRFTDADLALATDLGGRAGVALDNARLLRDAAEANAVKTEFLRTISHELRQPLNAMRGYLSLWTEGVRGDLSPMMRDDVDRLSRNQQHLATLIEDLLSFTRLDAGQMKVARVAVPIDPIFTTLEAMVRPEMDTRGVHFSYLPAGPGIAAVGDRDRIIQICLNLVTNAMRATPASGKVVIHCVPEDDFVTIEVMDTGLGIPEDKLEAIFAPFVQVGRALNAPMEGAGLGLAISRGLAEAMRGTLTVRSAPGAGSTFALRLPREG